ncbi:MULTISPECIES: DUF2147 domain-containing protein [unclassified Francisella]|uniref:DUF2147 domain-containing protein n=1 Tax=unclassified Francisella TaxID=2610885 RepID=UPI002E34A4D9|nr:MULTISPECIES: DUF2147 domain-containing protein [unclassified Francisella]MED7819443.1 DUF2147 domain-containing protein [Francisella sp. 19S2-4]MED7830232.1 DUF2147 domain-containing protein [Francisella sp. 19S2-10]
MLRKIILIFLFTYFASCYANEKKLLANGYWLQKDKTTSTNVSVIHAYNNDQGNLNAEIFVPLSNVDYNKVHAPIIYCKECGKGNAYGNKYDYSSGQDKYQGLEFVWGMQKNDYYENNSKGPLYANGAVLNPHDGKYYHVQAQTIEYGKKIYVRAFWGLLGKNEYWERISKTEAKKIRKLCGLTKDNIYPYEDKNGKVINQKLFEECSTRDFVKDPI